MFYSYILKSLLNSKHYYGHTANLEKRLLTHNAGRVRYTKAYRPWEIIFTEMFPTKAEAFKREQFYKSIEGYKFLKEKGII
ncbi:MAG: GIY-YIG nuclease family protein [Saprospiraceae bacterium]